MRAHSWFMGAAVALAVLMPQTGWTDAHSAKYVGSKLCLACHKATDPALVEAYPQTRHALTFFRTGEEKEGQQVLGDFTKGPGFAREDVAYVLGAGAREQAYLDGDFKLLLPLWNVEMGDWFSPQPSVDGLTQCIVCHTTGYEPTAKTWKEPGVGCESCHGPGGDHVGAKDKLATIVRPGELEPLREAMVCGQCHSLGVDKSGSYPRSLEYRPGDDLGATFTDARPTAHVPHAAPPWSQYSEWLQSRHAQADPVVICTTCHEPHGVGGLHGELRKAGNDLCLDCHDSLAGDEHAPASLNEATCASCHMPQGSHFFPKRAEVAPAAQ